jgi:hypothetical protein
MLLALVILGRYAQQVPPGLVLTDLLGGPIALGWGGITFVLIMAMVAVSIRPGSIWLRLLGCVAIAVWMCTGCLHSGLRVT